MGYSLRVDIRDEQGDINLGLIDQTTRQNETYYAPGYKQKIEWENNKKTGEVLNMTICGECYAYKLDEKSSVIYIIPILVQDSKDIEYLEEIEVHIN